MGSPQLSATPPSIVNAVDFLSTCGVWHNLPHILSSIFDNLDGKDLTAICCVNKTWRQVLLSDSRASRRRSQHLQEISEMKEKLGQENWPIKRGSIEARPEKRRAFGDIENVRPEGVQPSSATSPQVTSQPATSQSSSVNLTVAVSSRLNNVATRNGANTATNDATKDAVFKSSIIQFEKRKRPKKRLKTQDASGGKDGTANGVVSPRKVMVILKDENNVSKPVAVRSKKSSSLGSKASILHLKRL